MTILHWVVRPREENKTKQSLLLGRTITRNIAYKHKACKMIWGSSINPTNPTVHVSNRVHQKIGNLSKYERWPNPHTCWMIGDLCGGSMLLWGNNFVFASCAHQKEWSRAFFCCGSNLKKKSNSTLYTSLKSAYCISIGNQKTGR